MFLVSHLIQVMLGWKDHFCIAILHEQLESWIMMVVLYTGAFSY